MMTFLRVLLVVLSGVAVAGDAPCCGMRSLLDDPTDVLAISLLQNGAHATMNMVDHGAHIEHVLVRSRQNPDGDSAGDMALVAQNAAGDLTAWVTALVTNSVTIVGMLVAFSVLRTKFPIMYSNNVLEGKVPFEPPETMFGWFSASFSITIDQIVEHRGLDQGMLIEFSHFSMQLLATLGVPLICIMGPIHMFCGGDRSGDDNLSKFGMANIVDNHPWLYSLHAGICWVVVIIVQKYCYSAMGKFLERRRKWLMELPSPRSTTILVENIPDQYCSDDKLKEYFNGVFRDDVVENAFVVKKTEDLLALVEHQRAMANKLDEAKFKESSTGERPQHLEYPSVGMHVPSSLMDLAPSVPEYVDSINHYQKALEDADNAVKESRKTIKEQAAAGLDESESAAPSLTDPLGSIASFNPLASQSRGIYTCNGFVTFKTRRVSELALKVQYTADLEEFCVESPPDPTDIIYSDFQRDPLWLKISTACGYACIAGIFWAYLPFVVGCSTIGNIHNVAQIFPSMQATADDPVAAAAWNAMVGSIALTLFMSFVPTFICLVFNTFFQLKAVAFMQHAIQQWYFWFQVVYVMLVTAVGSSIMDTLGYMMANPKSICVTLATTMPTSSHFYLNFLPLQWVTHAQNCLRYVMLSKFLGFKAIYGEAKAKELAEPEDQDYYGIGGRSARWAFMLVLCLCFCSLSPLICLMGFVNAFMCRMCYGYLVPFAETKKADLGGVFFVTKLKHVQQCMCIYIVLMIGVIFARSASQTDGYVACGAFSYWYWTCSRFDVKFRWASLTFDDLMLSETQQQKSPDADAARQSYEQPELRDDF